MNRTLRVAVVARSVAPIHGFGGLERSVYDLVRYLLQHDAAVTLITRPPPGAEAGRTQAALQASLGGRLHMTFVPYRTFPFAGRRGTTVLDRSTAYPVFGMRAGQAAAALARDGRADLVHGFGASVLGYARDRPHLRAPLVLNPQGMEEFGATDPSRARLKRAAYLPLRKAVLACAAAADCVIATDRALEASVQSHLRVPPERVRVIPNALDLAGVDRLAAAEDGLEIRRRFAIPPDVPVLLSAGRIEANKGFHILASALGALHSHGTVLTGGWRWVVAGDGPYRSRLERSIASAGIGENVLLAGRCTDPELHAWYEAATVFVHPTLYEGSSLVTLEAMSHRRAVIASAAGGIPDKIRPGVNGWLVPPGDGSALAAAISGALGHPERLADMGAAGRAIVEETFSWTVTGAATLRMYEEVLRSNS